MSAFRLCILCLENEHPMPSFFFLHFVKIKGGKSKRFAYLKSPSVGRYHFRSMPSSYFFFVACSVELRSYGGLARRGTLSTFVPIQFAASVSIFILKIHARPYALNADVAICCYLRW